VLNVETFLYLRPKAYKALQQATRLSYRNWRVWENFLLVSIQKQVKGRLTRWRHT